MQLKENKVYWIGLLVIGCTIVLLIFSIFQLSPLIKATMQDWSTIQNSSSITQNDKDKLNASLDTLRTIGIVAAPISTIAGAFVLFLNFTVGNRTAEIANRNAEITESRLITERFSKAVEQLGSDTLEVCLGGIYSLEKIATDSTSFAYYNEIVVELLTAFIRETSNLIYENTVNKNKNIIDDENENTIDENKNVTKNPSTIQTALDVVGRLNSSQIFTRKSLDLKLAKLSNFELNGNFSGFDFTGATLESAKAYKAVFKKAFFRMATLNCVDMRDCEFQCADFQDVNLSKSNFQNANFQNANCQKANLRGANLRGANLNGANLSGTELVGADLEDADLRGVDMKSVSFDNALITYVDQLRWANNYEKARYDDDLRQELNIPDA